MDARPANDHQRRIPIPASVILYPTPLKARNALLRTSAAPIAMQYAGFPLCPNCNEPSPDTLRACISCGASMTPVTINGQKRA